jgi:hypothetical protein
MFDVGAYSVARFTWFWHQSIARERLCKVPFESEFIGWRVRPKKIPLDGAIFRKIGGFNVDLRRKFFSDRVGVKKTSIEQVKSYRMIYKHMKFISKLFEFFQVKVRTDFESQLWLSLNFIHFRPFPLKMTSRLKLLSPHPGCCPRRGRSLT